MFRSGQGSHPPLDLRVPRPVQDPFVQTSVLGTASCGSSKLGGRAAMWSVPWRMGIWLWCGWARSKTAGSLFPDSPENQGFFASMKTLRTLAAGQVFFDIAKASMAACAGAMPIRRSWAGRRSNNLKP